MVDEPKSLQEAILYFADPDNCLNYVVKKRWPKGVECPTCGSKDVRFLATRRLWECKEQHKKRQFSAKVGTVLEDSAIPLDKWLCAMWMVGSCKNGVSSYEIARDLRVTQKTAWFMLHRIRYAMQRKHGGKLSGEVEVDETFIGGKARNMHRDRKLKAIKGKGGSASGKIGVQGMLQRGGEVRAEVIEDARLGTLIPNVQEHVEPGSHVYTDEAVAYFGLRADYAHKVINHAECYVDGQVHTNGLENFWSLLKRGLTGTYISVEPFHLFRYNNRKATDADRFGAIVEGMVGRRLTYEQVTGKLQAE